MIPVLVAGAAALGALGYLASRERTEEAQREQQTVEEAINTDQAEEALKTDLTNVNRIHQELSKYTADELWEGSSALYTRE
jgi:hypothetical protein